MKLSITNTLSGKKELFAPLKQQNVSLYVCGITPYDYAHMGHGRCYVVFDLLYRLLTWLGYEVTYVRNFTDIDDKLLNKAELELGDRMRYTEIADRYMRAFHEDMRKLHCESPDYEPRVTENIPEIIAFIQGLVEKGKAYEVQGDVYFSIETCADYGKLSKKKIQDLQAGARVEINSLKRNPLDFALWKAEPEGMFWQSPWGYGRPGWHIECSAMALKFLGPHLDIHGGGMDLIFPHHENEIAQSEGLLGGTFTRYWAHNAFITLKKEKMSKSLGNFFTLRDIVEQYDPMVVRYYFLNHYFRAPLDFTTDDLDMMQKSYHRLTLVFANHHCASCSAQPSDVQQSPLVRSMLDYLCDDLNVVGMVGFLFEHLQALKEHELELCRVKRLLTTVLGLSLQPLPEKKVSITPEITRLLEEREVARTAKDWKRADAIRDRLKALGVDVHDSKSSQK